MDFVSFAEQKMRERETLNAENADPDLTSKGLTLHPAVVN
jgi:hypothetical protein